MADMTPIQTEYNGYIFRSRTEARWAIFFDRTNIRYEYEPEGFEGKGKQQRYLPDFYLPDDDIYVEVKPDRPNAAEELVRALECVRSGAINRLLVLPSMPNIKGNDVVWWYPFAYYNAGPRSAMLARAAFWPVSAADQEPYTQLYVNTDYAIGYKNQSIFNPYRYDDFINRQYKVWDHPVSDRDMPYDGIETTYGDSKIFDFGCIMRAGDWIEEEETACELYLNGYGAAKKARFEHGETPAGRE